VRYSGSGGGRKQPAPHVEHCITLCASGRQSSANKDDLADEYMSITKDNERESSSQNIDQNVTFMPGAV